MCSRGYRVAMAAGGADGFEGPRRKVLVTGAAGRTGSLVFKKLQAKPGTCFLNMDGWRGGSIDHRC